MRDVPGHAVAPANAMSEVTESKDGDPMWQYVLKALAARQDGQSEAAVEHHQNALASIHNYLRGEGIKNDISAITYDALVPPSEGRGVFHNQEHAWAPIHRTTPYIMRKAMVLTSSGVWRQQGRQ